MAWKQKIRAADIPPTYSATGLADVGFAIVGGNHSNQLVEVLPSGAITTINAPGYYINGSIYCPGDAVGYDVASRKAVFARRESLGPGGNYRMYLTYVDFSTATIIREWLVYDSQVGTATGNFHCRPVVLWEDGVVYFTTAPDGSPRSVYFNRVYLSASGVTQSTPYSEAISWTYYPDTHTVVASGSKVAVMYHDTNDSETSVFLTYDFLTNQHAEIRQAKPIPAELYYGGMPAAYPSSPDLLGWDASYAEYDRVTRYGGSLLYTNAGNQVRKYHFGADLSSITVDSIGSVLDYTFENAYTYYDTVDYSRDKVHVVVSGAWTIGDPTRQVLVRTHNAQTGASEDVGTWRTLTGQADTGGTSYALPSATGDVVYLLQFAYEGDFILIHALGIAPGVPEVSSTLIQASGIRKLPGAYDKKALVKLVTEAAPPQLLVGDALYKVGSETGVTGYASDVPPDRWAVASATYEEPTYFVTLVNNATGEVEFFPADSPCGVALGQWSDGTPIIIPCE